MKKGLSIRCFLFLLTPLREGRHGIALALLDLRVISTHAPAGGATYNAARPRFENKLFLLTPLREGRHKEATV